MKGFMLVPDLFLLNEACQRSLLCLGIAAASVPSTACAQHISGWGKGNKNPTNEARNYGEWIVHIFLKFKQGSGNRHINTNAYRKESMKGFCLGGPIRAHSQSRDEDWCCLWAPACMVYLQ